MNSYSRFSFAALGALALLVPSLAEAATLRLSPANNSVDTGSTVTERLVVSSSDQAMNAVSGTISFPTDLLQVVSISKSNSILSLWVADPTFSNTDGTISFSGIVPNPGYQGTSGTIFSIQFRAKRAGTATVAVSSGSEVLANDGNGTEILSGTQPGIVTISTSKPTPAPAPEPEPTAPTATVGTDLLPHITSSTHPDQERWYTPVHAIFDWTNAQGVTAIRLGYDQDSEGKPSVIYTDAISHKELDLSNGIWYFHVQEKNAGGWGPIGTFKVQIDSIPPLAFGITFLNGTSTISSGATASIQFNTTDEISGMDHYVLSIDGKEKTISADEGSHPYAISGKVGTHSLIVQAFDKAGNMTVAPDGEFTVTGSTDNSLFTFGWIALNYISLGLIALAILCTLAFAAWYIHIHFSAYRRRLNRQLSTTHTHVHKEFDNLKDAITEEILTLEQTKSRRDLTREEQRFIARFKTLLEQSEKAIEKDIEEIPR